MGRMRRIFNQIIGWLWRPRPSWPEDIPKKLDPETLRKALEEAKFLHSTGVDVRYLRPGELPSIPRRADTNAD